MSDGGVYLDYAATTPVDPRVVEAMQSCLGEAGRFANPSALHAAGRASNEVVQRAAEALAGLINGDPRRLFWTSGATEANNLAIQGVLRAREHRGRHLITMPTEHKAVTDVARALEKQGWRVSWLQPEPGGLLPLERLDAAIDDETQLVSIMFVNNETGVVQDIAAIAGLCRQRRVVLHVDAAQALGKLALDVTALDIDLLSMTAHKLYGPQGIGALYVARRGGLSVEPLFFGGAQQGRLRPGTLPVHLIAGFGRAAAIARESLRDDYTRLRTLNDRLWRGIGSLPGVVRNGEADASYPGILNVSAAGLNGESLLLALEPLCVSRGSACNSQSGESSAVLRSMGRSDELAESAVRFSFGRPTSERDIDVAAARYREAVLRLRALLPCGDGRGAGSRG